VIGQDIAMAQPVERRAFLTSGARAVAGAGALALAGCTAESPPAADVVASPSFVDLGDWEAIRGLFRLDPEIAHFDAFVLSSHPEPVRTAIERWRNSLDEDTAIALFDEADNDEMVRGAAARYLGVAPEEIAITDSTTMGLGLTYNGLHLERGDHIVTSTHDFYSTHEALRLAAARSGAAVEKIDLYDDPAGATVEKIVSAIGAAVRPSTRLVGLTWVHSSTGVKIPVREIADVLSEINERRAPSRRIVFCLDAVHGLGAEDSSLANLGCDVFISGTHKWLFGPRGTGVVWARRDVWDAFDPIIPTFSGPSFGRWLFGEKSPFIFGLDSTPGGYQSFEHRWALADAFEFHEKLGKDRVAARTRELASRLKEGLASLPNVRLVTPRDPELSSGIVCFEMRDMEAGAVLGPLRNDHGISASITPYRHQYVRFGTSIVTMPDQVDAAVEAIAGFR
jgi:selenocysteine lyase/cysteine desulfurase